jgi:hypothetical protein
LYIFPFFAIFKKGEFTMFFKAGDWNIVSSSGVSGTIGTPIVQLQVGGSYIKLPLKNTKSNKEAILKGYGGGAAIGVSIDTPISDLFNISMSTDDTPSTGLGPIFQKVDNSGRVDPYKPEDFTGALLVVTGAAGAAAINGTISMAMWQRFPIAQCVIEGLSSCNIFKAVSNTTLMLNPSTLPVALADAVHAIGFFSGLEATTDLASAGGNAFMYRTTL